MLKERTEFVRNVIYFSDLCIATAAFCLLRLFFVDVSHLASPTFFDQVRAAWTAAAADPSLSGLWLILLIWAYLLKKRGVYRLRLQTYSQLVTVHAVNGVIFFCVFSGLAFVFNMTYLSREFLMVYVGVVTFALILNHLAILAFARYIRGRGYNYRNLLLVGSGNRAKNFVKMIARHKEWGYRIIGVLDREPEKLGETFEGIKVLGSLDILPNLLQKKVVDEVCFVIPRSWLKEIEKSILYCEAVGVPATLSTDFFDLEIASGIPKEMDGLTYLSFETRLLRDSELFAKRVMDVVLSIFFLALAGPLMLAVAVAIKLDSEGPVFFRQIRRGRNGRKFVLYKFRSMIPDAEHRLEDLKPLNELSGPVFKITKDPRITRLGSFLRKTSIDELPQFWNVIRGDMSIVGPRPALPDEIDQYEPWQRRRLSMKPGITCIWQVSGRNEISFQEWMKLDLQYIDRWSMWLDIQIIFQTAIAVLTRRGAK